MTQSYFQAFVDKYLLPIVQKVTERINDKKEYGELLYTEMTTPEFSADLKYGSNIVNNSIVAADVVSLDSSLPLKQRGVITHAQGDLPKIGLKYKKGEKDILNIKMMMNEGATEQQIAQKIMDDAAKCITAIKTRWEIMFEKALSTGVCLVDEDQGTLTGVRLNFGYKAENILRSLKPWTDSTAKPIDDIRKVINKAEGDGNPVSAMLISKKYFNLLLNSEQGKTLVASYLRAVVTNVNAIPTPSQSVMLEALKDALECEVKIVSGVFRYEKNGAIVSERPWKQENIAFLPDMKIGRLVYGNVAEKTNPIEGVSYVDGENGILISKYAEKDPITEYTAGQVFGAPIIDNGSSIYLLQCDKNAIEANPTELSFTASAGNKTVTISTDAESITAVSDEEFATVSVSGKVVTVAVTANSGGSAQARTATVTVTDSEGHEIEISVNQAA